MDTGPSLYPSMVQGLKRFFSSSWLNCSLVGVAPPWERLSHIFAILHWLETSHRFCLIQGEEVIHNTGTGAESGSHANSACLICYLCSTHCVFSTRTRALAWFLCSWLRRLQSSNHELCEEVPTVFSSKLSPLSPVWRNFCLGHGSNVHMIRKRRLVGQNGCEP